MTDNTSYKDRFDAAFERRRLSDQTNAFATVKPGEVVNIPLFPQNFEADQTGQDRSADIKSFTRADFLTIVGCSTLLTVIAIIALTMLGVL